ncbi:hypothetical protein CPC08DRAFT_706286 [Agrocybe pediades]|nr:hypothetical protein CPC08DRAFT_706286 [Agrocybe pediades]
MALSRYKLVFFAPKDSTKRILDHLFETCPKEVGTTGGNYDQCAFISRGTGQFRPNHAANPAIGTPGQLEYVEEDRVELIVDYSEENKGLKKTIRELKKAHPYEEVAYDVFKLEDF